MARSALSRAIEAADGLEAVLRRPRIAAETVQDRACDAGRSEGEDSVDANRAASAVAVREPPTPTPPADPPEHTPAIEGRSGPFCLAHTDWLHHRLDIKGPADAVAGFRQAACGVGPTTRMRLPGCGSTGASPSGCVMSSRSEAWRTRPGRGSDARWPATGSRTPCAELLGGGLDAVAGLRAAAGRVAHAALRHPAPLRPPLTDAHDGRPRPARAGRPRSRLDG